MLIVINRTSLFQPAKVLYYHYLFVSMLQPVRTGSLPLPSQAYFLDHLNNQVFFLGGGALRSYHTVTQEQRAIVIAAHTAQPTHHSHTGLLVLAGEALINVNKNMASVLSEEVVMRGSAEIVDGSLWEWYAPISLQKVKLGICKIEENEEIKYQLFEFNSSTPRNVTFSVQGDQLLVWVNGHPLAKRPSKTITYDSAKNKWYPCVKLQQRANTIFFCPFPSTKLTQASPLNPFAKVDLSGPIQEEPTQPASQHSPKITRLIQLSNDRFLAVWDNNSVRVFERNPKSGRFDFSTLTVLENGSVVNAFTEDEYSLLKEWRGQAGMFSHSHTFTLQSLYSWLKFFICSLDHSQSDRLDIYALLLTKLALIRPYLPSQLKIPNPIRGLQYDFEPYQPIFQYFSNPTNTTPLLVDSEPIRSALQFKIQGNIVDVSRNYLVTQNQSTIIVYNLRQGVNEVFRQAIDKKLIFSKRNAAQAYEEQDIRNLKSEGSFLYKILSSCLQKEKKAEETHAVNENDVKELVRDYGIDQAAAREALEETGHVEEALVWIFTDRKEARGKRGESLKEIQTGGAESVHLVQVNHIFARALLQVGNKLFLLGVLPSEIKHYFESGELEFTDLLTLKHEDEVTSLDWQAWYAGSRHPRLHILDQIQTTQTPDLLFREGLSFYHLVREEELYLKKNININTDLLYEPNQSLSLSSSEPLEFFPKEVPTKTISGELIAQEVASSRYYLPDTVWSNGKQLYSNSNVSAKNDLLRVELDAPSLPELSQNSPLTIPLLVESGPPGCSSNYSITSILHTKSSFLANYPQQVVVKHLQGKLIKPSSLILRRSTHRKNINYIQEGEIYLVDQWGTHSNRVSFSFTEGENEKEVGLDEKGYWKYVVLSPKFTSNKKLPFEYGFISVKGWEVSSELYHYHYLSSLSSHLTNTLKAPLTAIQAQSTSGGKVTALLKLEEGHPTLTEIINKAKDLSIGVKSGEVVCQQQLKTSEEIGYLKAEDILRALQPPGCRIEGVLRRIARSPIFSFSTFSKIQVLKFADLALYYTGTLLPFHCHFASLFTKLWENQWGKEYLLRLSQSLDSAPTIPFPYLTLLAKQLDSSQHIAIIKSLLSVLPRVRSPRYQQLDRKYSHLLFQSEFYSDYYFNLVEGSSINRGTVFGEAVIEAEILSVKEEHCRRIIIRLPGTHYISNFTLRVQRSEQSSKANYSVYVLGQDGKRRIGSGRIQEHQWVQIARQIYKQQQPNKDLNIYGLEVGPVTAQYLQIQLAFTETGVLCHKSQASKVAQVDIIPELYGYPTDLDSCVTRLENLFTFNPEEMFFLSVSALGSHPLQKYSVSKGKQTECIYFKPQREDQNAIKARIQEKIEKGDLESIPNLQRKLLRNARKFSNKLCLDYLYTALVISLSELEGRGVGLQESICSELFELVVRCSQGPVKAHAFRALSKSIPLLVKSLQYVEQQLPSLGKLTFSYEELLGRIDLANVELCHSLTRLILRVVDFEPRWAELLIKMSPKTQSHEDIVRYFLSNQSWLQNTVILQYVAEFPDSFFESTFLPLLSYQQLCRLVTKPSSKPRLELLLQVIVEQASSSNQVDLDVVSLIFQQEQVRWQQLEKVVTCCPQAVDTVVHQFLQADNAETLALQHFILLTTAATPKYSEEFALFLTQIYSKSRTAFKEVMLSIIGKCELLHYDCLETIGNFIFTSCNFGGIEGVRLLTEEELSSLTVAVEALKAIDKLPQAAEVPTEDGFIQWYLANNDYEDGNRNPANKAGGYHLMRQLGELVRGLLKSTASGRVLAKYAEMVKRLRGSRRTSKFQRHIKFSQLHHGATQLLSHSLAPGALADVLIGQPTPALPTVLNELKASMLREGRRAKWNAKQVDISDKFQLKNTEAKDLQGGKSGTKSSIARIPVSQRILRLQSPDAQWPSKFLIGFSLNDHADCKNAVLPVRAELYAGSGQALFKAGELRVIEDQHFLSFGVKVFGINLSTVTGLPSNAIRTFEVRLSEAGLASASEILENSQRSKKGATFNLSFVSVSGYDTLPADHPDYSQLYLTLLGFLGQPKYLPDLRRVVASELFDQKLELIIQVLNDLLPNELIQNLLLALNREGENILEHVLRSNSANPRLVSKLLLGKLTKDNIGKLLTYTLQNISRDYVDIVTMSVRLASYALPEISTKSPLDFSNIERLLEKYGQAEGETKQLYFQLLTSLLTVPNIYHYEISKLVQTIWNNPKRSEFYSILAAVLPYYTQESQIFAINNYTSALLEEVLSVMEENRKEDSVVKNPAYHFMLLNTLNAAPTSRNILLAARAPIKLVQLLKSEKSLLLKYSSQAMKQLIAFFQGTCIGTECQDEFSEILISLMTSLNNFDSCHHQFFIQSFFFPLINAFSGVPLFFVWRHGQQHLWQPTDVLKKTPIRTSSAVVNYKEKYYAPVETITEATPKGDLLVTLKENGHPMFRVTEGEATDLQAGKKVGWSYSDGKLTIEVNPDSHLVLPNEKYRLLEESQWQQQLLTNSTLINLNNPWVLQEKYRAVLPIRDSTPERAYFLPQEMTLAEVLKHINISGFRVHPNDLPVLRVNNLISGTEIPHDFTLKQVLSLQKLPFLRLEVEASQLFNSTTIETLVEEVAPLTEFVPQETIFKAFEEKKGLEKLIGVLTGCVKNWTNAEQSKLWEQYLKELQSYSCFPVFSSLYMTRQTNVGLLFDLLFGLPDKQDSKKWVLREKESVRELYGIIKEVFAVQGQQAQQVRSYALSSGFYATMLNRLHLITKEPRRERVEEQQPEGQEEVAPSLAKKESEEEFKNKLVKRKGVGYGNDSSTNQKWDVSGQEEARKEQSEQILGLLRILEKFLDYKDFDLPDNILQETYESALLPIIENSLRGGSLLQISKYAELIQGELSFLQVLARSKKLVPTLMAIPKCYEPKQPESLHSLLKTLANTAKIFLSCLTGSASEKVSEEIAKKITATFQLVDGAVSEYQTAHNDEEEDRKVLELPLGKKYPLLLKDLRFDYIDMKDNSGKITKHHYASYYQPAHKSPVQKTVRLAQELADVSHALPIDHTNAIFVRCDKERVDYMQALIMGSNGTPYGHGAYLFDIYFEDNYPSGPPKVNLTTTGNGQIRFNPNLYSCGKVCLSLLGTWRGSAMENWDPKVSTLLQVLVSIQSIIMSEDIYFNEPGFQHEQGTLEGQKKNEAYANIVRYGNVKFAMIDNIKNPPKGFETVIRRHFYLKREEILEECQKWLKLAEKREASYNGLVSDHNYNWCNTFKKSKGEYKTMLEKAVKELEMELNKLPPPTHQDLKKEQSPTKPKRKQNTALNPNPKDDEVVIEEIDVSYGTQRENVQLDINDQKVKDRWSRYIGAMGVQAVSKQSKASILLLGLGGLGVEIAKNIVLSGCREFSVWDGQQTQWQDLSGQFFLGDAEVGKSRLDGTIFKLQELNHYVKVSKYDYTPSDLSSMGKYQVVIATGLTHEEQLNINQFCRSRNIHFLSADCYGPYGQVFNDFGEEFQILDKNGEETVEVILEDISNAEKGLVRVSKGLRHPFEDGETVRIAGVKGMKHKQKEGESINGTLHKVQVVDQFSFYIGNTLDYHPYEGDGTARNIKTPLTLKFKSLSQSAAEQNLDANLEYYDFTKGGNLRLLHRGFIALSSFRTKHNRLPAPWSRQDSQIFLEEVKVLKPELTEDETKYLKLFSYTCSGSFGPICAFYGGIVSQEVFKAITGKYTPIHQYFLADFSQVIEDPPQTEEEWTTFLERRKPTNDRREGIVRVLGSELLSKLENSKIFMVGSGAIGCQLLKNFAMLEVGAGENGSIVVTDPDHIETSNLNRQFLFRQKHLRKPKSATAAAAVTQMNPRLKGHIKARLDKVCEGTKDIFSNSFFEGLSIVANALDNVEARRYVDSRCVENKIALLESGTLSSKGHVQVIIPYKTETYGSKQDPNDANGEVPHCTLKMFPEETLHCVEWARDLFGKDFTLAPKALAKLLESEQTFSPTPSDIQMLKDCIKMLSDRPAHFEEAAGTAARVFYQLFRNDIMQLLYTYPLDAKTKDGKPFWRLPKRPPTPIEEIVPEDPLHATFIASYAVLICKVHNIPYPKDFRDPLKRKEIAEIARGFKVEPFEPSDKVAKEMAEEVNNEGKQTENPKEQVAQEGEAELFERFRTVLREIKEGGETPESKPEEFQKDQDQNGHIDIIYSMANLRARNYKLQEMQWISVKLKAGRIMPALSTTTSCIAALQTIQLIKYLKGCKTDSMRNAFINLAVPLVQLGEPGQVEKIKVHENLTTNIWERWNVSLPKTATLRELISQVEQTYGVIVKGLDLVQGGQVYSDIVLGLQSKKEQRERVLGKSLNELLQEQGENAKYSDFTLVMGVKDELIKHAPTLRVTFA